jgi:hypothetical protein
MVSMGREAVALAVVRSASLRCASPGADSSVSPSSALNTLAQRPQRT